MQDHKSSEFKCPTLEQKSIGGLDNGDIVQIVPTKLAANQNELKHPISSDPSQSKPVQPSVIGPVRELPSSLYDKWRGRNIHNPTEADIPEPWVDRTEVATRLKQLSKWHMYLTSVQQYQSRIMMTGITTQGETVSLISEDFCPFLYVDAPEMVVHENKKAYMNDMDSVSAPLPNTAHPSVQGVVDSVIGKWNQVYAQMNAERALREQQKRSPKRRKDDDDQEENVESVEDQKYKTYYEFNLRPIKRAELVWRKPAVIYHTHQKPYLRLEFNNVEDMGNMKRFFVQKPLWLGDMANTIGQIRTYHENWTLPQQFRMTRKLKLFGWCEIDSSMLQSFNIPFSTSCHANFVISHRGVKPVDCNDAPPWVFACFDLETVSFNEMQEVMKAKRGEPRASITFFGDGDLPEDIITSIGTDLFNPGNQSALLRMAFQVKSVKVKRDDLLTYTFDTEEQMLRFWITMIRKRYDVSAFAGFNSIAYDMPYLIKRCRSRGLVESGWMSRLYEDESFIRVLEKSGGSKQRGDMKIQYVDLPGVSQFDAYIAAKAREKLDSYSLKEMCKKWLKGEDTQKEDLDYKHHGTYFLNDDPSKRGEFLEYCAQDVQATRKLMDERGWLNLYIKIGNVTYTEMKDLMLAGTTIQTWQLIQNDANEFNWIYDEKKRLYIQWLFNGKVMEKLLKLGYTEEQLLSERKLYRCTAPPPANMHGAYSYKSHLYGGTDKVGDHNERRENGSLPSSSSINEQKAAPSFFSRMRGTKEALVGGKRALQIRAKQARDNAKELALEDSEKYEGGYVRDAVPGFYRCGVATLDFASLYPSVMQARRLCSSTFLPCIPGTHLPDLSTVDKNDVIVIDSVFDGKFTTHWVQTSNGIPVASIVPKLEDELVAVRKVVKDLQKTCDPSQVGMYKMHELSLKVCANGMYGALASVFMAGSLRPIAMATCAFGRLSTKSVIEYVEQVEKLTIIYGDTDSIFLIVPEDRVTWEKGSTPHEEYVNKWRALFKFTKAVADRINKNVAVLRKPMKMEFEKIMFPFLQVAKKNYAGKILNEEFDPKTGKRTDFSPSELYMRGFPTVRRDTCPAVRKFLTQSLDSLFQHWNPEITLKDLKAFCNRFVKKQVPFDELITTVQIKAKYEPNAPLKQNVLMRKLRDRGIHTPPGTRVPFIMIEPPKIKRQKQLVKREFIEHDDYAREHKLTPWYAYYLDKPLTTFMAKVLTPFGKAQEALDIIQRAIQQCSGATDVTGFFNL